MIRPASIRASSFRLHLSRTLGKWRSVLTQIQVRIPLLGQRPKGSYSQGWSSYGSPGKAPKNLGGLKGRPFPFNPKHIVRQFQSHDEGATPLETIAACDVPPD